MTAGHAVPGVFQEIVDLPRLQRIFERFSRATGFTTALFSYPDQQIIFTTDWRDICTKFHRANPDAATHCLSSNRRLTGALQQQALNICPCENGLVDGATPVIVRGVHVASLATGQVFLAPPDEAVFRAQAERFGFDTEAYLAAMRDVPVVTEAQLRDALAFLSEMAAYIAEMALMNLEQQELAARQRVQEAQARATNDQLTALLNAMPDLLFEIDAEGRFLAVHTNDASRLYRTPEEFLGKTVQEVLPASIAIDVVAALARAANEGVVRNVEYALCMPGGTCWFEMAISRCDAAGQRFLAISRDITARMQTEQALRESRAQIDYLIDNTHDFILQVDMQGTYLFANKAAERFTGYRLDEVLGLNIATIIAPEYHALVFDRLRKREREEEVVERPYEIEILHRDGHRVWVELATTCIYDTAGRPVAVQGIARDISARKRDEQRLTRLRDCFLTFGPDPLANINQLTAVAGELLDATCALYNRLDGHVLHALGQWHTPPDFQPIDCPDGHICTDVIRHPSQAACVLRHLETTSYAYTDPNVGRYGLQTYVGIPVFFGEQAVGSLCVVYVDDVTPREDDLRLLSLIAMAIGVEELRMQALHDLAASEMRYRSVVNTIREVVAQTDLTGRLTFLNPAWTEITGFAIDASLGQQVQEFMLQEDRARNEADFALLIAGEVDFCRDVYRFVTATGHVRWIEVHARLICDANGVPMGTAGTMRDITEQHEAEATRLEMERRFLHAQKLESLGVLAGGIAHDFNNLLMAIIGNLDIALLNVSPAQKAYADIQRAIQASHRATDLTRQMLAYSGRGHFEVRAVHLSNLVRENAEIFRAAISRTVTFTLNATDALPPIIADPGQVQQVIMNLLTNASEAIGAQAGSIVLTTGTETCDAAYLQQSQLEKKPAPGSFVYLEVADTGCGMDPDTLAHLFDPFFTTKFTGRGLGMSAVLGIVQGHQGALFIDSTPGRGTRIRILFPTSAEAAREAPAAALATPEFASASQESPCLLVVDDDNTVRIPCIEMLQYLGYTVLGAADGEEALALCRTAAVDVVLLDLTMPRMDGVETFQAIRQEFPDLPVVLCSGYTAQEMAQRFTAEKPNGFLQKPYRIQDLRDMIDGILARPLP
jgi:PAS domain S-box-containing protein